MSDIFYGDDVKRGLFLGGKAAIIRDVNTVRSFKLQRNMAPMYCGNRSVKVGNFI